MALVLTEGRDTQERQTHFSMPNAFDVTDASQYFAGGMVMIDAAGLAVRADDIAGVFKVVGRCEETRLGDVTARINTLRTRSGVFSWDDAGSDIVIADIGENVFVVNERTIQKAATANSIVAGTVYDVRDGKVWVLSAWPIQPASAPA